MSKSWIHDIPHYYQRYMDLVPEDDYEEALKNSMRECLELFENITDEKAGKAYSPGKWTIKEVLQHVSDGERIFAYRALAISRGEKRDLHGFDQDEYVGGSEANKRDIDLILNDFDLARASTRSMFSCMSEEQLKSMGRANGFDAQPIFYAYLLSGHLRHHLNVIKERYLS